MAKSSSSKADQYYAADRASWRQWLVQNHADSRGLWLVYDKAVTGKRRLSYDDIVDEAVSFGWIDSLTRSLDAERAMLYLSPRKPRSPWSRSNKERVARLVKKGLMSEAGSAVVEAAKRDGSWHAYDAVEQLTIPSDLEAAFVDNKAADRTSRRSARQARNSYCGASRVPSVLKRDKNGSRRLCTRQRRTKTHSRRPRARSNYHRKEIACAYLSK